MIFIQLQFFRIFFVTWTLTICLLCLPLAYVGQESALFVRKIWAKISIYMFQMFFCCKIEIINLDIVQKHAKAIFASKHQSALETILFCLILNEPIYILKKELAQMPIFGAFIRGTGMIDIERKLKTTAIKKVVEKVKRHFAQKHPRHLVIFPEGTRTLPGQSKKFQSGAFAIYRENLATMIPVALNTGCFWPKTISPIAQKRPKKCIIKFLEPLPNNLEKQDFLNLLQEKIDNESNDLMKND